MTTLDRPAAIRHALCELVAERGFHGTSMSAIAGRAGVAVGTAYVHYESKDELVFATYLEIKSDLGNAVLDTVDPEAEPEQQFDQVWRAIYEHLRTDPARARFLTQMEESPYFPEAVERLADVGDPLVALANRPEMATLLVPLPPDVLYSLSLAHAVRLAAADEILSRGQIDTLIASSWRAITRS